MRLAPSDPLSEKGQTIQKLVAEKKTLSEIIAAYPDLIEALDEYVAHERHEARIEGKQETTTVVGHNMAEHIKKAAGKTG